MREETNFNIAIHFDARNSRCTLHLTTYASTAHINTHLALSY